MYAKDPCLPRESHAIQTHREVQSAELFLLFLQQVLRTENEHCTTVLKHSIRTQLTDIFLFVKKWSYASNSHTCLHGVDRDCTFYVSQTVSPVGAGTAQFDPVSHR